jgi:hypothetical protein
MGRPIWLLKVKIEVIIAGKNQKKKHKFRGEGFLKDYLDFQTLNFKH